MKIQLITLLIILSTTTIIAQDPLTKNINIGQNNITISDYFPSFPVSYFISQYPNIESVTVTNYYGTYGYVNVFGGVGTDFLIEPNQEYEIYSNSNLTLIFG